MINKVLSSLIRAVIAGILGFAVGVPLNSEKITIIIWIAGLVYIFVKFSCPYSFVISITNKVESKINLAGDEKSKRVIESDMLRTKNLFDIGILNQDEYDKKIQILKDKYLS